MVSVDQTTTHVDLGPQAVAFWTLTQVTEECHVLHRFSQTVSTVGK